MEPEITDSEYSTAYDFNSENASALFTLLKYTTNDNNSIVYEYDNNNFEQSNNEQLNQETSQETNQQTNQETNQQTNQQTNQKQVKKQTIILSSFTSSVKGEGKKLLCQAIDWIQENLPNVEMISLSAVPFSNVYRKLGLTKEQAHKKLNAYYQSLGFSQYGKANEHYFRATVQTIAKTACTAKGGRTRRRKGSKKSKSRKH